MPIDLRHHYPRGPREELDGIKLLPRAIDKVRAQLAGTLADYIYFGCGLNRVLFETLGITDEQFLDTVRNAESPMAKKQDREALDDLRESHEDPGVFSDEQFLDYAMQSEIDNAVVSWVRNTLKTPQARIDEMNERIEHLMPQTLEAQATFEKQVRQFTPRRTKIHTFVDLLDYEEGRLL